MNFQTTLRKVCDFPETLKNIFGKSVKKYFAKVFLKISANFRNTFVTVGLDLGM